MSNAPDDLTSRLKRGLDRGSAPALADDLVTGAAARPLPHLSNPARTVRIAGGATLAVAALTVGALVAVPALNRPAPLFEAAAGDQGRTALSSAGAAESSDMKIGWWVDYNYSAGPSLSTQGGSGNVYRLVLDSDDPAARTAELAEILGIDGEVGKADYWDATYPTWVVGPQDGTAPSLSYSAYGTGDWWFNDPEGTSFYVCDDTVTAEQSVEYGCTLPADAPENLAPGEAEARALAAELFAATGFDIDPGDIEVLTDDWGTTANAYLVVDGERTALAWSAYWANNGVLSYAYGHTLKVEARGSYGTVSPTAAVDRLEDGRWWGSAGPDFQGGMMLFAEGGARDAAVSSVGGDAEPAADPDATTDSDGTDPSAPDAPAEPTEPGTSEPNEGEPGDGEPSVDPTEEPLPAPDQTDVPVDPMPEPTPEVVNVTIDNATPTLLLLWDVDGNAWLVPGYSMQMDEGWWNSVVSLVEGVITLPEPVMVEPAVLEEGATY